MANVKISELPVATSLSNGDSFPVVQGGVTKQAARSVLFASPTFTGATTVDLLTATGDVTFDGGAFVFNESGADKDARFEGDTDANLLFLDASTDRVGIGTSTPAAKLDVDGAAIVRGFLTPTDAIKLGANTSAPSTTDAFIYRPADNTLAFGTASSERMRLDTNGNLGIGTSSPGAKLDVFSSGATLARFTRDLATDVVLQFGADNDGPIIEAAGVSTLRFFTSAGERMRLDASGNLFCQGVYNNTSGSAANVFVASNGLLQRSTSSLKYKTDIQDATHGLVDVMRLRPVTYKSKTDGDRVFGGLIAEEVHSVGLTEFVQYADDGSPDALAYGNMVALLIKAIQEQQAVINELRARVAALEAG